MIQLKNGSHQFISEVFFVSDMKSNLLNLGQFMEKGYHIILKDNFLTLLDTKGKAIRKSQLSKTRMFRNDTKNDVYP